MTAESREGAGHRLKALAYICGAFGISGFPLAFFVIADGAPLTAFGVYVAAAVLCALAVTVWAAERILNIPEGISA